MRKYHILILPSFQNVWLVSITKPKSVKPVSREKVNNSRNYMSEEKEKRLKVKKRLTRDVTEKKCK